MSYVCYTPTLLWGIPRSAYRLALNDEVKVKLRGKFK